jgi:RNA recognition motif-containing protein
MEEPELKGILSVYGQVSSVKLITDKDTGKRKGFGFIEMPDDSQAQHAIAELNGMEIKGRKVSLSRAVERSHNQDHSKAERPRHKNYEKTDRARREEADGNRW